MERREFLTMAGLTGLVGLAAGTLYESLLGGGDDPDGKSKESGPDDIGVESNEGGIGDGFTPGQRLTIEQLQEEYYMLNIDDDAYVRFVDDWDELTKYPLRRKRRLPLHVIQAFLLSTDFFQNGMNEKRKIKYVKLYDPYVNPCYNPLLGQG